MCNCIAQLDVKKGGGKQAKATGISVQAVLTCPAVERFRAKAQADVHEKAAEAAQPRKKRRADADGGVDLDSSEDEVPQDKGGDASLGSDDAESSDQEAGASTTAPVTRGNGRYQFRTYRNGVSEELILALLQKVPTTCIVLPQTSASMAYSLGGVLGAALRFNEDGWGVSPPCTVIVPLATPVPAPSLAEAQGLGLTACRGHHVAWLALQADPRQTKQIEYTHQFAHLLEAVTNHMESLFKDRLPAA